jgi:hypothetical protein
MWTSSFDCAVARGESERAKTLSRTGDQSREYMAQNLYGSLGECGAYYTKAVHSESGKNPGSVDFWKEEGRSPGELRPFLGGWLVAVMLPFMVAQGAQRFSDLVIQVIQFTVGEMDVLNPARLQSNQRGPLISVE